MRDIALDVFDYPAHRVMGSAEQARGWIDQSSLDPSAKVAMRSFVDRFPTITFYRDSAALLNYLERRNEVTLPHWLREVRQTLSGPAPEIEVRFDDFDHLGPTSDDVAEDGFLENCYSDHSFGYLEDEQRTLFVDGAGCYPILSATTGSRHLLAVNLLSPDDERILSFCDEDIMDARYDGKPGTVSVYPAFDSYPRMLSRIVECRLADGTVVHL